MRKIILASLLATTACATSEPAEARRIKPAAPMFSIAGPSAKDESEGSQCFNITKSGSNGKSSIIGYRVVEATAERGTDFTLADGTLTFTSIQTARQLCATLINDIAPEPTETYRIELYAVNNSRVSAEYRETGTITDNDTATQTCWDGSVIATTAECPEEPVEEPPPPVEDPVTTPPDPIVSPSLSGLPVIASNFDINTTLLQGSVPGSAAPDTVGAFRFICGAGQLLYDDPIVYPGEPGRSHLHQFYGNLLANGNSTYTSLRLTGDSTCSSSGLQDGNGVAANRSAYWMPAMMVGAKVWQPDYVSIYYKQRPNTDPIVSNPAHSQYRGKAIQLPNGLRFIFGYDMLTGTTPTGALWYNCSGAGAVSAKYSTITTAMANCPVGAQMGAVIQAPECWDGVNIDSSNHRNHVSYSSYGTWGYLKCPTTHPYVIPTFTLGAWYTVTQAVKDAFNANNASVRLVSDDMHPSEPKGKTFHADFFMAWDPTVHDMWWNNCINKLLNCSAGQLGNGKQLKGAAQPIYGGVARWTNPNVLVDPPGTPVSTLTNNKLVIEGDSISVKHSGGYPGTYAADANHSGLTVVGGAVGGSTIVTMTSRLQSVLDAKPEAVTVLIGANDLLNYSSGSAWLAALFAYTDQLRAAGIKVGVGTLLPRVAGNVANQIPFNTRRAEVNAAIRAAVGTRITAVIDYAADPVMGPDAAATDTALYMDGLHPTYSCGYGCGGQGKLAAIYHPVADALLGVSP
jgi:lysophospholipase L1-like esterase